jgi:hypothetical protein
VTVADISTGQQLSVVHVVFQSIPAWREGDADGPLSLGEVDWLLLGLSQLCGAMSLAERMSDPQWDHRAVLRDWESARRSTRRPVTMTGPTSTTLDDLQVVRLEMASPLQVWLSALEPAGWGAAALTGLLVAMRQLTALRRDMQDARVRAAASSVIVEALATRQGRVDEDRVKLAQQYFPAPSATDSDDDTNELTLLGTGPLARALQPAARALASIQKVRRVDDR